MSRPASRVLAMLELLQVHHRLTGAGLAARLGVDERTVRRYAGALADLGVPVTADRGRYGGYRLLPGYKLPPLMLTDDEAVAVLLGLLAADRLGLGADAPAAHAKISRVLPRALATRLAAVEETLGFTLPKRTAAAPDTGTLLTLGAAARDHRRVVLLHRDVERTVDPYGLVFHAGRWYLAGHDELRGQLRTFRLDRIGAVRATGESFAAPGDFDAVAHVVRTLARAPYTHRVEVLLETDLAQARRRVPPTVADLTETGGGVLLTARAESLAGMAQLLAGLGHPFTVRTPDALRAEVAALAARLGAYAARPGH